VTPVFSHEEIDGMEYLNFANESISLRILPSVGGKIISLRSVETGREFLLSPRRPYAPPTYGGAFPDSDFSGWDECFPAIGEGPYPDEPWRGTIIPDHGEVWTLPWSWRYRDGVVHMATHGVRFPYRLERWLDLRTPDRLRVRYRATNLSPFPFRCLWSPHPMLSPAPSWRILLPPEVSLLVDSSTGDRLGPYLNQITWPTVVGADGEEIRLDLVGPPDQGYAHKVFAGGLTEGWAGIHDTETDEALIFTFSPTTLPFVGLAVATGSAAPDQVFGYYAIVEPCNGRPDNLATAATHGASVTIAPLGSNRWEFELRIETAFSRAGLETAGEQHPLPD
jgi:galactose mutarotase-like enzyme